MIFKQLPPIKESTEDFDTLEQRIRALFKREIYYPLLTDIGGRERWIQNAPKGNSPSQILQDALHSGKITFSRGIFSGKFSGRLSKALRDLGAKFNRREGTFKLVQSRLPVSLRSTIAASEGRFQAKIAGIDKKLSQLLPEEIADRLKASDLFDSTLWKTNKKFVESVKAILVPPQLTDEARKRIAAEWQTNIRLYIKEFTEKEIIQLRTDLKSTIFAGNRYGSLLSTLQKSYGVSARKAKFLARQETGLLMAKFKETRYADAGIQEYTWHSVTGSKLHPVRARHKFLAEAKENGQPKLYRFDDPPVTNEPGEPQRKNNPGQDYNCRCFARPVVRLRKK